MFRIFKKYKFLIIPLFFITLAIVPTIKSVSAENVVGWYTVIDDKTSSVMGFTVDDKVGNGAKAEERYSTGIDTNCSQLIMSNDTITSSKVSNPKPGSNDCVVSNASSRTYYAWTWPASVSKNATAKDFEQAEWVNETLVNSLNLSIQKVISDNEIVIGSKPGLARLMNHLAQDAYKAASNGSTVTGNYSVLQAMKAGNKTKNYSYTIKPANKQDLIDVGMNVTSNGIDGHSGWSVKDFVKLTTSRGEEILVPFRVPKGYASGQDLYDSDNQSVQPSKISWSHIVYQSAYSKINKGIDAENTDEIFSPSGLEELLNGIVRKFLSSVSSALGLYDIEELTLNRGVRAVTYYKGLMPRSWFNGASLIYWVFQIAGIFIVAYGFIRLMIQKNTSVVNPGKRIELMDGIMNLAKALALMLFFIPCFTILATFNELIVKTLGSMVSESVSISATLSQGSWIGIVIEFAFLFILFKINVTYIVRAVTIAVLYASAPLFISFITTGERGMGFFQIWIKELCINIFLQTFNAIMTVIFLLTLRYSNLKIIERLVILMSYVGLTDYFKNTLMDSRSGADNVADKATGALGTMAGTAVAGVLGGATGIFRKSTGAEQNQSGYGGSKYSGGRDSEATLTQHMDEDQTRRFKEDNQIAKQGGVGALAKKPLRAVDKKLSNSKYSDTYKGVRNTANAVGKVGRVPARALGGVVGNMAMAGVVLGSEAVGANSFEARRRLATGMADSLTDFQSLTGSEYSGDLRDAYCDFKDGNTEENELSIPGLAMQKEAGISSLNKLNKGVSLAGNSGALNLDGEELIDSEFEKGDDYAELKFDVNSTAYQQLNNVDTRSHALNGMRNIQSAYASRYGDGFKMEMITSNDKSSTSPLGNKIEGYRFSVKEDATIRNYQSGANPKANGKNEHISNKNYMIKGVPIIENNKFIDKAVTERGFSKNKNKKTK